MKNLSPEEAVRILENMKVKFPVPRAAETQIKRNAALEMAIKALATDINVGDTDTISRAKAIDGKICIQRSNGVEIYDDYAVPVEYLEQLPPAQPKRGRWIGKYPVTSVCSECGFLIHDSKVKAFAYCPNCGAEMEK